MNNDTIIESLERLIANLKTNPLPDDCGILWAVNNDHPVEIVVRHNTRNGV